jgi:hypothetical protein
VVFMKLVNSNVSNLARAALLCAFGSALISLPAPSNAASTTPTIGGGPTFSVPTGSDYSSVPRVIDTESSRCIRFEIDNKPAWASFDETTGRLWGRPDRSGTYGNISIRVVDWCAHVTNPTFSITVVPAAQAAPANAAPTISGHASTVVNAGMAYSFTPTAADASHDELSFSIQNMPNWATFDTAFGTLSGTPAAADVGRYANIKISVSDGKSSAALPAFTVSVNQMSAGNATLDWIPPTENTDGSVLTDLAGYNVHYGTSPNKLTQVVKLANPGLTSYVLDNLTTGTWYFAITSYAVNGMESSVSGVVSTTIL